MNVQYKYLKLYNLITYVGLPMTYVDMVGQNKPAHLLDCQSTTE